ncbi:MAG: hypothetical protein ACLFUS_04405 [Candidatus Sumerlaeia bacterium]
MSDSHEKKPAEYLRAVLNDTKEAYAHLLVLIEQNLQLDPVEDEEQVRVFQGQIQNWMNQADTRLAMLNEIIQPWDEKQKQYPQALVADVDAFLSLLKTGLESLKKQVDHKQEKLQKEQKNIREALDKLTKQRKGFQGYKQVSEGKGRIRKEI